MVQKNFENKEHSSSHLLAYTFACRRGAAVQCREESQKIQEQKKHIVHYMIAHNMYILCSRIPITGYNSLVYARLIDWRDRVRCTISREPGLTHN